MKKAAFVIIILSISLAVLAQNDTLKNRFFSGYTDSVSTLAKVSRQQRVGAKHFIAPAALVTLGSLADLTNAFKGLNSSTRNEIVEDHPYFRAHIDNYMQYMPGAAVFALQAFGVRGGNTVKHEAVLYAISLGINSAFVVPLKHIVGKERPDKSNNYSYPSGHTSNAFASAEFLRREYRDVSPWYGIGGYAVAAATGLLRMYNNRHWLGDVVAGAGFGIASTNLAYLLYDRFNINKRKINKGSPIYLYPVVSDNSYGIGLLKTIQ